MKRIGKLVLCPLLALFLLALLSCMGMGSEAASGYVKPFTSNEGEATEPGAETPETSGASKRESAADEDKAATWSEESEIRKKSLEILKMLSLEDLCDAEAGSLPFGKQRAVEFARALASEPKLLLLDEPASGLNLHESEELAELILKIRDLDMTVLLVEHDMSLVMDISDEIVVLNYGKKIAEGTPAEIQKNQEVISIYLGEDEG